MMEFVRSEIGVEPIIVESYFPVSPTRVYEAWTDPIIVKKWFGLKPNSLHSVRIDLQVGGTWEFVKVKDADKSVKFEGTYIDIQPSERLVFSWSLVSEYASGERDATPPSQVELTFSERGSGTDVRLVHSSIASDETCTGFAKGWEVAFGSLGGVFLD